jgi:citrate lyase subunit beta/citryl-CoA lyase
MNHLPGPALLFCPGDRPERFLKAQAVADVVALDLEDAVAPDAKALARRAIAASGLDPERTLVRINPPDSPEHADDLAMVRESPYQLVMLPKAEKRAQVEAIGDLGVIALCETAAGVLAVTEIAQAANAVGLMWGAEDLLASLGGFRSRLVDNSYVDVARTARTMTLLAARANGLQAIDAVYLDHQDSTGLALECELALADGFSHKACIHPSQVDWVRRAYLPSRAQLEWARAMLTAAAEHAGGVLSFRGRMIDEPLLRQARTLLARASGESGGISTVQSEPPSPGQGT